MKFLATLLLCLPLIAPGSELLKATGELRIAAASDLKFALDEIVARFTNTHSRCTIKAAYGASGNLFAQIQNGAPFDIFLSADTNYPHRLVETRQGKSLFYYAEGHLALWVPNSSKLDLEKLHLNALLDSSVRKIAIANPAHAPYGRAAVAALKDAGIYERVSRSLVLGENVAQTAQFVQSGGADIAILSLSLVRSAAMRDQGRSLELPGSLQQAGVLITRSTNFPTAEILRDFVLSTAAREIFERHGLAPK